MTSETARRGGWLLSLLGSSAYAQRPPGRIEAIDLARGFAIALMILSHGISGMLGITDVPGWGMVPVHLITKFSSSLFILVFGIALAVAFVPHADSEGWARRRNRLWLRALIVLFWYKVLTVVEMAPLFGPEETLDALLYRRFPIWVEILGFYAIALLWVPLILPIWRRAPLWMRVASPILLAVTAYLLGRYFHFWDIEPLQAILVEHGDHYTWGQLTRGPLVLVGLLIGEAILRCYWQTQWRYRLVISLLGAGLVLLAAFLVLAGEDWFTALMAVAHNEGKHPPELMFMLFSVGGALALLALCLWGGERLAGWLRPITVIGSDALKAFVFHIVVIFLLLRYLLGMWQAFSYPAVLMISLMLIPATALWIWLSNHLKARS